MPNCNLLKIGDSNVLERKIMRKTTYSIANHKGQNSAQLTPFMFNQIKPGEYKGQSGQFKGNSKYIHDSSDYIRYKKMSNSLYGGNNNLYTTNPGNKKVSKHVFSNEFSAINRVRQSRPSGNNYNAPGAST